MKLINVAMLIVYYIYIIIIALRYSVVVDSAKSRAALYQVDEESQEVSILDNTYSDMVTISGPGIENKVCVQPLTFALSVRASSRYSLCISHNVSL